MKNTHVLLSVEHLKKYFPTSETSFFQWKKPMVHAVEDASFYVSAGETFALVGESGCGKSTLGRAILQLIKPTQGRVYFQADENGERVEITSLKDNKMREMRKYMQIIFQDPYSSLNPRMTVEQIIQEGVLTHHYFKKGSAQIREYTLEIMQNCGLQSYMRSRYSHEFSGGQRQRVCIARALALKPKFVVCDECVSALDVSVQSQILNLLCELKEKEKLTYLFISHDLSVVRHIADKVAVMYLGEFMETGSKKQVFENALHPYTIALLSAAPSISPFKREQQIILGGNLPSPVYPPKGCKFHTRCFMAQSICRQIPAPLKEVEDGHFCACHFAQMPTGEKRKRAKEHTQKEKNFGGEDSKE